MVYVGTFIRRVLYFILTAVDRSRIGYFAVVGLPLIVEQL